MKNFQEWIADKHPEYIEEGWAKNLALGGALLGVGIGLGSMKGGATNNNKTLPSYSVTSDNAANYLPQSNSTSWTSDDAANYLSNDQTQKPMNAFQRMKADMHRRSAELKKKTAGLPNGKYTFVQGQRVQ